MKAFEKFLIGFPEYYLVALVLLSGYAPPLLINPLSIGLSIVLLLQILFRNQAVGIAIAVMFALVNAYMLFSLISEFRDFPEANVEAYKLLGVGLFLFLFHLFVFVVMLLKYTRRKEILIAKPD